METSHEMHPVPTDLPGPRAQAILARHARYVPEHVTPPSNVVWETARDCRVWDADGREYIDFTSGILVANVGHAHPKVTGAIQEQAAKFLNCYSATSEVIVAFLERLAGLLPPSLRRILLFSTGAEAVDAAVRLARAATGRHEVMAFTGAFHGRSLLAMSLAGMRSVKQGFGPVAPGVLRAEYPYCYRCPIGETYPGCELRCFESIERAIETQSSGDVAALVMEPYLGTGGGVVPPRDFVRRVVDYCRKQGILFILDEVQSSFGRTGRMFAFEALGIEPDLVCLAKGIASGVPLSAVAGRAEVMAAARGGAFGSTFGGAPLACAAGSATIDVLLEERLVDNASEMGAYLLGRLKDLERRYEVVGEARGMGLSLAVEFVHDKASRRPAGEVAKRVADRAIRNGLVMFALPGGAHGNVLRMMPPLTITRELVDQGVVRFEAAIRRVTDQPQAGRS